MTEHVSTLYADTLVFQLTEVDVDNHHADLRLYFVYDYSRDTICVFGRRMPLKKDKHPELLRPFALEFENQDDVYDFIRLSVDHKHNRFEYAMYAMHDLPADINDFSFHLLENFAKRAREICAFDDMRFSPSMILSYLELIVTPIMGGADVCVCHDYADDDESDF